jgi:hypothetical protein
MAGRRHRPANLHLRARSRTNSPNGDSTADYSFGFAAAGCHKTDSPVKRRPGIVSAYESNVSPIPQSMKTPLRLNRPGLFATAAFVLLLGLPGCAQVPTSSENHPSDSTNASSFGRPVGGLSGPQGFNPYNALSRLDDTVTLTDDQKAKAIEIFNTEAEALNAIPQEDGPEKGAKFRQAASAQIRALLTPEQRQRLDASRHGVQAQAAAEQAIMANFIRSSKVIAARLGTVASMSLLGSSSMSIDESRKGDYVYSVVGSTSSETLKLYWEQTSPTDQIKIVKIEGNNGETIQL